MVLVDSVKYRCERDLQWEAPKKSRDLIASAIKHKPLRATNFQKNLKTLIEQLDSTTKSVLL